MTLSTFIIVFIFVDLAILCYIISNRKQKKLSGKDLTIIKTSLKIIDDHQKESPKQAILEADKLLDFILKKKGFHGTLGEKLKKSGNLFSDLNQVWSAHKLRNKIAHELNINLSQKEADAAINAFKKAYRDLGAE